MAVTQSLIVGGGMSAAAAVRGIREVDPDRDITIVGAEPDLPYKRPPLTKGLWQGESMRSIATGIDPASVRLRLGRSIARIDPIASEAVDDEGTVYRYENLLLATGSSPRLLPFASRRLIHFSTLHDYRRLRELTDHGGRFAVIGGGFIGSEIGAALASIGKQVTMIFPGTGIGSRLFPEPLALWLNGYYMARGVRVVAGASVDAIDDGPDTTAVRIRHLRDGSTRDIEVDGVVAGIGTDPATGLARAAGLPVDDGIIVDGLLNAGTPDIYASGDVARAWVPALGGYRRFEHEDGAKAMGRAAGRAMAGAPEPYTYLPLFYSDLFELGYEAIGDVDARLDTVADWDEPYARGTVYYLRDDRVCGVLLWNVWDRVDAARALIASGERVNRGNVRGWLLAPS